MTQPFIRGHAETLSVNNQVCAEPFCTAPLRPQLLSRDLAGAVRIDPNVNWFGSGSSLDHKKSNTTRQQRFNVGFIANYTSDNMPAYKPRTELASASSPLTDTSEPQTTCIEPPVAPSVELSALPPTQNAPVIEDHAQGRQRRRDPSVERCPGCNEAWKRPLPNTEVYHHNSPAENNSDLSKITMNMIAQLVDHGKKADAMYDRWKWRHSHCVPSFEDDFRPLTPPGMESHNDSYVRDNEAPIYDIKIFDPLSNKRKVGSSHDEMLEKPSPKPKKIKKMAEDLPKSLTRFASSPLHSARFAQARRCTLS